MTADASTPWGGATSQDATDSQPVLGGTTDIALTSAGALQGLGVTVSALGNTTLGAASDGTPLAEVPITGGTQGNGSSGSVILHQGSGLELSDSAGSIDLSDFRVDTQNSEVFANVTAEGTQQGNAAVFTLGTDGALTLTQDAATLVDSTLGTIGITDSITIGTADPMPQTDPGLVLLGNLLGGLSGLLAPFGPSGFLTAPIIGGSTSVTLDAAGALTGLGVSVGTLGAASLDTSGTTPVATFPITGGTAGGLTGDVILHQGSGLELSDAAGTVDIRDLLIDQPNGMIDANVTANGTSEGNVVVFDFNQGGEVTLTDAAAHVLATALGTDQLPGGTAIGTASTAPVASPLAGALAGLASASASLSLPGLWPS